MDINRINSYINLLVFAIIGIIISIIPIFSLWFTYWFVVIFVDMEHKYQKIYGRFIISLSLITSILFVLFAIWENIKPAQSIRGLY
jgi:H+/Cl- antiporter ClcA